MCIRDSNKDDKIDEHLSLFRKDEDGTRKAFSKWASEQPELNGLSLESVNYSGEAILIYEGAKDPDPVSNAKEISSRLQSLESVRYADPDFNAFPGMGD